MAQRAMCHPSYRKKAPIVETQPAASILKAVKETTAPKSKKKKADANKEK